tara:strand:+ start:1189 stop:1479 length:291 start_codon:yes stop_codon:yes gene_type:complete
MKTFLIIIAVLAVIGAGIWIGTKYFGLFTDKDKDGIPDEVEDTVKEVKRRAKRVKEELKDVVEAAKDVADQAGDIGAAVKGKPRKGRKPRAKKASK